MTKLSPFFPNAIGWVCLLAPPASRRADKLIFDNIFYQGGSKCDKRQEMGTMAEVTALVDRLIHQCLFLPIQQVLGFIRTKRRKSSFYVVFLFRCSSLFASISISDISSGEGRSLVLLSFLALIRSLTQSTTRNKEQQQPHFYCTSFLRAHLLRIYLSN